jgi:hypothetical protein
MNMADVFVIYDEVEYSKNDWRNRNRIKTSQGIQWLTIPVNLKGKSHQAIRDIRVSDGKWHVKHWKAIQTNYGKAGFFQENKEWLSDLYYGCTSSYLSEINFYFLEAIREKLGISTKLLWSSELNPSGNRNERLINICRKLGATEYISGPAARDYLDTGLFKKHTISVKWMDYSGYPQYTQLHGQFEHGVTVLDLILNEGPDATDFMKSFKSHPNDQRCHTSI